MTLNILRIDTSARKTGSISRDLTDRIVAQYENAPGDVSITTRDLTEALPQITEAWIGANFTPVDQRSDEQRALLAQSDALVAELQNADVVVIGLPVYNFRELYSLLSILILLYWACQTGVPNVQVNDQPFRTVPPLSRSG